MKKVFFLLTIYCLLSTVAFAQSVDILWQGDTYTPPFYKGRALWSTQSRITFLAIPNGVGNPTNLIYRWTKNGTVLGNINGLGRNTLAFTDSILSKPQTIEVEVLSNQNTLLASASIIVTPISPVLAVYKNNPLYGFMFHREESGIQKLLEREVTYTAFPLFFSTSNRINTALDYEWRTNVGKAEKQNSVTYRTPDNTTGSSEIRVNVLNKEKITQTANKSFLVQFENTAGI